MPLTIRKGKPPARRRTNRPKIDVDAVRIAAAGRWPGLLSDLAGVDPGSLDGGGHPCPWCEDGDDRFAALPDFEKTGAVICRACFDERNGDGFAAVAHANDVAFIPAVRLVWEHLTARPAGGFADLFVPDVLDDPRATVDGDTLAGWCAAKAPADPDAAILTGAVTGRHAAKWRDREGVAFPAKAHPDGEPVGWLTLPADGGTFPTKGGGAKSALLKGSSDGWVFTCTAAEFYEAETVVRVEGIGCALALAPHLPVGTVVVSNICGAKSARNLPVGLFKGKRVIVVGDADEPGRAGAAKFAGRVAGVAASVAVAALPYGVTDNNGKDVRDFIGEADDPTGAADDLLAGAADFSPAADRPTGATRPTPGDPDDGRAEVRVVPDEYLTNDAAIAALAAAGGADGDGAGLYRRGTVLVRVVTPGGTRTAGIERPDDAPTIFPLDTPQTRDALTRVAKFTKEKSGPDGIEVVPVHPPYWCVGLVHKHGQWPGLPALDGLAAGPVLRPDGTVLSVPGYDPATRLLLPASAVRGVPPIPSAPSRDNARRAADVLLDVVSDFPFAAPEHAAAWIAGVLTPLARPAFEGPTPLFLIDAPTRGSGKGLLADVTVLIALGRPAAVMTNPQNDEEARKRITALAMAGDPVILIDNIDPSDRLGGAALDAALTATEWRDRVLGESRVVTLPLRAVWLATGNNVALTGDTARRVIHVRLDPGCERPEERTGFRRPDLKRFVREHRGPLLAAGLTILRAYVHAGRPVPPGGRGTLGSFEGWCALVRDALVWAGLPDPLDTRAEMVETADRSRQTLAALLEGLERIDPGGGLSSTDILRRLSLTPASHPDLLDAVLELCDAPGGKLPGSRTLGNRLRTKKGTVCAGRVLDSRDVSGSARWFVRPVDAAVAGGNRGSGGSGGSDGPPRKTRGRRRNPGGEKELVPRSSPDRPVKFVIGKNKKAPSAK